MQRVDMFIMTNQKYLPAEKIPMLRERLLAADDGKMAMISAIEMKDPTTILLISIFLGSLGIDRFMLGETGMGILKLLTCGCCGILTIIDWFTVQGKAKEANFMKLMSILSSIVLYYLRKGAFLHLFFLLSGKCQRIGKNCGCILPCFVR